MSAGYFFAASKPGGFKIHICTGVPLAPETVTDSGASSVSFADAPEVIGAGKADTLGDDKLAEGAATAPVLVEMAKAKKVDMPIAAAVAAVLDGSMSVDQATESLLTRPLRAEH